MAPKPKDDWLPQAVAAATNEPKAPMPSNCDTGETERFLQKFGVSYSRCLDLPLSKIDERKSRANQVRKQALIEDSVGRYTADLKKGDEFPPVIGYTVGEGSAMRVVLIDGNNRDAAHRRAGRTTIRAYVLDPDTPSAVIRAMMVNANAYHGVTPDLGWRVLQAEDLIGCGWTPDQACGYANVTRGQLAEHQRQERAVARAKALKISGFGELPGFHKGKLAMIQSDPVFLKAAMCVIDTKMTTAEVAELTRELKGCSSEAAQIAVVDRVAKSRDAEIKARKAMGARRAVSNPVQSLVSAIGKIMHVKPDELDRMLLTDIDRANVRNALAGLADRVVELQIVLEPGEKVG